MNRTCKTRTTSGSLWANPSMSYTASPDSAVWSIGSDLDDSDSISIPASPCRYLPEKPKQHITSESSKEDILKELDQLPTTNIQLYPPSASSLKKSAAHPNHVKRPLNSFMIFSQIERRRIKQEHPTLHHTAISKQIAFEWNRMSDAEKEPFRVEADRKKLEHKINNPGYKYKPNKKKVSANKTSVKQEPETEFVKSSSSQVGEKRMNKRRASSNLEITTQKITKMEEIPATVILEAPVMQYTYAQPTMDIIPPNYTEISLHRFQHTEMNNAAITPALKQEFKALPQIPTILERQAPTLALPTITHSFIPISSPTHCRITNKLINETLVLTCQRETNHQPFMDESGFKTVIQKEKNKQYLERPMWRTVPDKNSAFYEDPSEGKDPILYDVRVLVLPSGVSLEDPILPPAPPFSYIDTKH